MGCQLSCLQSQPSPPTYGRNSGSVPQDTQAHRPDPTAKPDHTSMGNNTFSANLVLRKTVLVDTHVFNSVGKQSMAEIAFQDKLVVLRLEIVANAGAGDCLFLAVLQHFRYQAPTPFMVQDLRTKVSWLHVRLTSVFDRIGSILYFLSIYRYI